MVERHPRLVHGLEQARLRLRRGAIDLVGQHDVGEERPGLEHELADLGLPDRYAQDVRRQHVGGELDALELPPDRARQRRGQCGLAHAGHVLDEEVAAGEQAHHGQSHGLGLADHAAADVVLEPPNQRRFSRHGLHPYYPSRGGKRTPALRAPNPARAAQQQSPEPPPILRASTSSSRVSSGPCRNAMRAPLGICVGPSSSRAPSPVSRAMSASRSTESKPKCSRPQCALASPEFIRSFVRAPEMLTLMPPSALAHRTKRSPNTRTVSLVISKPNAVTYHSAVFRGSGAFRWMWL